ELGLHLARESGHRLLVVGRGDPGDDVVVAELEVGRRQLDDLLGRADGLVRRPRSGTAVALEAPLLDPTRLRLGIADEERAHVRRPFDLPFVAPERLAVLAEDRLLAPHVLEAAAEVVRVGAPRDEL